MVGKNTQIYGVQITGKCIWKSKNWIFVFTDVSMSKFYSILMITILQREVTHSPPDRVFWKSISSNRKKESGEETKRKLKKWSKLNLRG